jgi:polyhydroxyalkanoate depolymerase
MNETPTPAHAIPLPLPLFWPVAIVAGTEKAKADLALKNLEFLQEELKLHGGLKAKVASPNVVRLDLRTMVLRDYGRPGGLPTLVNAPFAGHRAMIADYRIDQSLVGTLLAGGLDHVALTDWKSATDDMKDFEIDNYLEELVVAIDDLGGRVNLVGLCQGGWSSAMVAARFPDKVNALVLAGSPIDTAAGDGPIKRMAHDTPMSAYEDLVKLGGGRMRGQIMLAGWKNMHPEKHYVAEDLEFYQHMDDPAYRKRVEVFDSWYEDPLDLPGRWYLQAIRELFKENRLAKGKFVGLGRRLNLKTIVCPLYLLAGESDDITTSEQVFAAETLFGTTKRRIEKKLAPGGHIGLFMGSRTLKETWPTIARWLADLGSA